jgi:predicted  nucleic acid-binding Zn-ribbon protein
MAVRLQALRFLLGGAAVVFFSLAQVCSAQYPDDAEIRRIQKLTPAEIEKRIAEINAEIEHLESSLQASAVWKERIELEKRIREMKDETDVKLQPLRDRLDQLERAPSVVKRDGMIERLRRELRPLEYRHRKLVYDEGIRLCEQRHAALKKRTQAATPELQQLGFDVLSFPRIDGSTSSQPLAVLPRLH